MNVDFEKTLAESRNYRLVHEFEKVFLVRKSTGNRTPLADHYGDPLVGLIDEYEQWIITGGEGLVYFDFIRGIQEFFRKGCRPDPEQTYFVHSMRPEGEGQVRILIDPWSGFASTWVLHVKTLALRKLRDGPSLTDEPYQDEVEY